eukprot:TRINITY_DN11932_c0_g3_i1.p1 TRINITY_DN11932_c0_g3~~TRINITY_DN11932_c0_g3_i1.p1  ORF type:complete len:170 (+),score=38.34 TRINITY_DN11932_c0_g3_i1:225-734(+)
MSAASASDSVTAIKKQLDRWRELWSSTGAGKRYNANDYRDLFVDSGDDMLTFDAYVPDWASTQINGFDQYALIWNKDINERFPKWTIVRMDVLRVEVTGDMAWSAMNFWGQGFREDGEHYEGSQHGTHSWKRVDGRWRILHEHLTGPIIVRGVANAKIDSAEDVKVDLA